MNPLRPLGLGELIDRAVNFWRAHWKPLFGLMLPFQLVQVTVLAIAQALGRWFFPLASDPEAIKNTPNLALPDLTGRMAVFMVAIFASLLVAQLAGVATTHFAFSRLTGRGLPNGSDSFRHASERLATTTLTFFLTMTWSVVVMVLLLLPAVGLGVGTVALGLSDQRAAATVVGGFAAVALVLGSVVLVVWFAIRFILVSQIIAIEPLAAVATFRRADALSSGRVYPGAGGIVKLRLTLLVTIVGVVLLIMSAVGSLPTLFAGAAFGANFTPGHTLNDVVPLWVLVPLQLVQSVLGAVLSPLYVVFQTFFYTDMRVRREGLDLELALT